MFSLPKLPYAYDALEPFIDKATMEIHHDKHHQTYVNNLNVALEKYPELQNKKVEDLLKNIGSIPAEIRQAVINNGGGHANHTLFWELLTPEVASKPEDELATKINEVFGTFEDFKTKFTDAAIKRFGSGWAWLVKSGDTLEVYNTANQESPLSEGKTPILTLDVWEHAYYLKYQNRRADYIEAWWNIVNWAKVKELFLT